MIEIKMFNGAQIAPWLDAVAALRIAVFRDWPYLYAGDRDYEKQYLATYAKSAESLFVLALDGTRVIGASTGIPLADETAAFQKPFLDRGIALGDVFYFGESVLLPAWRGRGIGHAFFDAREAHARALGRFRRTAFCSVDRAGGDPRCPPDYRPNDVFWHKRGYARRPGMTMWLDWNEAGVGEVAIAEVRHPLTFWLRDWEAA